MKQNRNPNRTMPLLAGMAAPLLYAAIPVTADENRGTVVAGDTPIAAMAASSRGADTGLQIHHPLAPFIHLGLDASDQDGGGAVAPTGTTGTSHGTADEVAAKLSNPNADLAKLVIKNQFRFYEGTLPDADDQWGYTLLFQPVFPFGLGTTASGNKRTLFVRPAFPLLIEQPVFDAGSNDFTNKSGLGDIGFDIVYALSTTGGWQLAAGMAGTLPSATDSDLGGGQLRLGPELLVGHASEKAVWGVFPSHQWNVSGRDGNFSTTKVEPFITFMLGGGWTIGTDMDMSYDWENEDWTIPLNLKIGKTVEIGRTPVQFQLDINYYVEQSSEFGPDWMIGLNVTPVVENFIENFIKGRN